MNNLDFIFFNRNIAMNKYNKGDLSQITVYEYHKEKWRAEEGINKYMKIISKFYESLY